MLAGRPPFRAERTLAILNRICTQPHRPIREVNSDVPPAIVRLLDRLLAKATAERYENAATVRADCLKLLSDGLWDEQAVGASGPRVSRWRKWRPYVATASVLGAVGLLVAFIVARPRTDGAAAMSAARSHEPVRAENQTDLDTSALIPPVAPVESTHEDNDYTGFPKPENGLWRSSLPDATPLAPPRDQLAGYESTVSQAAQPRAARSDLTQLPDLPTEEVARQFRPQTDAWSAELAALQAEVLRVETQIQSAQPLLPPVVGVGTDPFAASLREVQEYLWALEDRPTWGWQD